MGASVKERLILFIENRGLSKNRFEEICGLSKRYVSNISQSIQPDKIKKISLKFPELNTGWLLTGEGEMLFTSDDNAQNVPDSRIKLIPLLPFSAAAGYMMENNGWDPFRGEAISVKDFTDRGADCAIRVDGDSMVPRYNNGDMIAIKILKDPSFFQWGRVYVLSTTQGCVVKKLFPDPNDSEKILCHSENTINYPDYSIPKAEVLAVAIVVGHAGVE